MGEILKRVYVLLCFFYRKNITAWSKEKFVKDSPCSSVCQSAQLDEVFFSRPLIGPEILWSVPRPPIDPPYLPLPLHFSVRSISLYIKCITPIGTHRRPPAYTHTAKKESQPSAMLKNSQVAKSRRKISEITGFIALFLFCKLSLASLLSPVATQWW